jgi:hypothetical protein
MCRRHGGWPIGGDRHPTELGASAVEFAIILPIVVILTFGLLTGGLMYHQQLSMTHAAREAARFGATYSAGDVEELVQVVADRAEDSAHGVLDPGTDGGGLCVAYVSGTTTEKTTRGNVVKPASAPAGRCLADDRGDEPRVQIVLGRHGDLNVIFARWEVPLRGTALARHEVTLPVED